jgi:hypothetical protein
VVEGGKEGVSPLLICALTSMDVQHSYPSRVDGVASPQLQPRWVGLTSIKFAPMEFCGSSWPNFTMEPCNVQLGLTTYGMNLFGIQRSHWSTWPIVMLNYNILPWLTTKKHFVMLSLIIPSPQSIMGEHFDVYLKPMLDELKMLWEVGIDMRNARQSNGESTFKFRAIFLWMIHDLPAYGIVVGCITKGYQGCPCFAYATTG